MSRRLPAQHHRARGTQPSAAQNHARPRSGSPRRNRPDVGYMDFLQKVHVTF